MIYTESRGESIELARSISRRAGRDLGAEVLRIKGARFYVLKGCRMPAILVETGYLSNYSEERMLKNSFYRQKLAEAIFDGVNDYSREIALTQAR
jgi:N-acetylmuramoyl-L-alanine amidase